MVRLTAVALAALALAPGAAAQQAPQAEGVQITLGIADVVRCTSVYKAVSTLSPEGSEAKKLAGARALQWGTAAFGFFSGFEGGPTRADIEAAIAGEDGQVAGEVEAARQQARENGSETALFAQDFARCDALMRENQPLFAAVNQALRAKYGGGAES